MLHPYQILLPLLSLFLCRVDLTDLIPLKINVEIREVLDGDTLTLAHGNYRFTLRLAKVDAPEKLQPYVHVKGAGRDAKKCLLSLLKTGPHQLKLEKYDIYGRALGDLDDLNFQIIKNGCAGLYPHAQFHSRQERMVYLRALKEARKERRGVWAKGGFRQPKLWRKFSKRSVHRR